MPEIGSEMPVADRRRGSSGRCSNWKTRVARRVGRNVAASKRGNARGTQEKSAVP